MQFIAVRLVPEASSVLTGDISSDLFAKLQWPHWGERGRGPEDGYE